MAKETPEFFSPKLIVQNFGYNDQAGGWRIENHLRLLANLTGKGKGKDKGRGQLDIAGFGNGGMWVSFNQGDRKYGPPEFVYKFFGYDQGWRVDQHPRFLADLTGDGCADVVGFKDDGVWVGINQGNGTFKDPVLALKGFSPLVDGWQVDRDPILLADLTGDGCADIVGFGDGGVWVARNAGNGKFEKPKRVLEDFGYTAGNWRVDKHLRFVVDVTGDGRADIVGFGDDGVLVAPGNGDGTFGKPTLVLKDFGYYQGWRVDKHQRILADLTGDGRVSIVGFGDDGVLVALNTGHGNFGDPTVVLKDFGYNQGWLVDKHPRFVANLTGNGRADIIGFRSDGVLVAFNTGDGKFGPPELVINDFGYTAGNWRVEKHLRFVDDLTGDHRADILGFGDDGVMVAWSNAHSSLKEPAAIK